MTAAVMMTHYANANFLRSLAEMLPRVLEEHTEQQVQLLQDLANTELEKARYDEWMRQKVAASLADPRPLLTQAQVEEGFRAHMEQRRKKREAQSHESV